MICGSPLRGLESYEHAARLAARRNARALLVSCTCSNDEVWRKGLTSWQRRPAQKVVNWTTFLDYRLQTGLEPQPAPPFSNLELGIAEPFKQTVERALGWLHTQNAELQPKEIST